jgi:hypothetical protein
MSISFDAINVRMVAQADRRSLSRRKEMFDQPAQAQP